MRRVDISRLSRPLAVAAVLTAMLVSVPAALAAPVTTSLSGAYGYWQDDLGPNYCNADWFGGYIAPIQPYISGTPRYPNSSQTIRLNTRIDYWNGSAWVAYKSTGWKSRNVHGTGWALFTDNTHTVPQRRYYRVVQFYEWWVGSTRVGTATNVFDQRSYDGYWVAQTGSSASYCYVP